MNTSSTKFSEMTIVERWQHYLRRKFQLLENVYYPIVDDLAQKLSDLDGVDPKSVPDFDIHQFSFIREWQDGDLTSQHVLTILNTLNMEKVATTQLTRRLTNYIFNKQNTIASDYVLPCREMILTRAVPIYILYLEMLRKYFTKLVEVDQAQEKITWIEQMHNSDQSVSMKADDLTLNQVIRQLDHQVIPFNSTRYTVGDNLICLDEEMARGAYAIHWICAPKAYIDELKKQFKITDVMDIAQEADYIKKIIGVYIK